MSTEDQQQPQDFAPTPAATPPAPAPEVHHGGLGIEDLGEPNLGQAGDRAPVAGVPGQPPAGIPGAPMPAAPKWTPEEARLIIQGGVDAAGLPLYIGRFNAFEREWHVKEQEVDGWSASAARLLDRTPFSPGAAGLAGLISDGLVTLGGMLGVAIPRLQIVKARADGKPPKPKGAPPPATPEGPESPLGAPERPDRASRRVKSHAAADSAPPGDAYHIPDTLLAAAGLAGDAGEQLHHGATL